MKKNFINISERLKELDLIDFKAKPKPILAVSEVYEVDSNSILLMHQILDELTVLTCDCFNKLEKIGLKSDAKYFYKDFMNIIKEITFHTNCAGKSLYSPEKIKKKILDLQLKGHLFVGSMQIPDDLEIHALRDFINCDIRFLVNFTHSFLSDGENYRDQRQGILSNGKKGFCLPIPLEGYSNFKYTIFDIIKIIACYHEMAANRSAKCQELELMELIFEEMFVKMLRLIDIIDFNSAYIKVRPEDFLSILISIKQTFQEGWSLIISNDHHENKNNGDHDLLVALPHLELYISHSCNLCKTLVTSDFYRDFLKVLKHAGLKLKIIDDQRKNRAAYFDIKHVPTLKYGEKLIGMFPKGKLFREHAGYTSLMIRVEQMLDMAGAFYDVIYLEEKSREKKGVFQPKNQEPERNRPSRDELTRIILKNQIEKMKRK